MSDVVRLVRADQPTVQPLLGVSVAMRRVVALGRQFAPTPLPIVMVAPTGCGKELLTQHIYHWSGRTVVAGDSLGTFSKRFSGFRTHRPLIL